MKKLSLIIIVAVILVLSACSKTEGNTFDNSSNITVYTRDTTSGTRAGFFGTIGFPDAETSDSVLVQGFVIKDNTITFAAFN